MRFVMINSKYNKGINNKIILNVENYLDKEGKHSQVKEYIDVLLTNNIFKKQVILLDITQSISSQAELQPRSYIFLK